MDKRTPDEGILQNLADAGCDEATVAEFCATGEGPLAQQERLAILCRYRKSLLAQMHVCQKKLDCLDYLVYKLKGGTQECARRPRVRCTSQDRGCDNE